MSALRPDRHTSRPPSNTPHTPTPPVQPLFPEQGEQSVLFPPSRNSRSPLFLCLSPANPVVRSTAYHSAINSWQHRETCGLPPSFCLYLETSSSVSLAIVQALGDSGAGRPRDTQSRTPTSLTLSLSYTLSAEVFPLCSQSQQ